jgi:hypothetical protein
MYENKSNSLFAFFKKKRKKNQVCGAGFEAHLHLGFLLLE